MRSLQKYTNDTLPENIAVVDTPPMNPDLQTENLRLALEKEKIKNKRSLYRAFSIIAILVVVFLLITCFRSLKKVSKTTVNSAKNITEMFTFQTEIPVNDFWRLKNNDVSQIVQQFKDAGFLNITIYPDGELKKENWKNDKVTKICVDGQEISLGNDIFNKNLEVFDTEPASIFSKITIYYHSTPDKKPEKVRIFKVEVIKYTLLAAVVLFTFSLVKTIRYRKKANMI